MRLLARGADLHNDASRLRREAERRAGQLWKDIVFRRLERQKLSQFVDADRRLSAAIAEFEARAGAALQQLRNY